MHTVREDVILKFSQGHEDAFEEIYRHFYRQIFTFCRYLVQTEEARDITAEIFVKLWKMKEQWDNIQNIKAFLYITARNNCLALLRDKENRSNIEKKIADLTHKEEQLKLFAEIESELIVSIHEEVEKLPEYYKTILKLSYYEGYKNQEIAEKLGINEKTVRNAKSIAMKKIKTIFDNRNMQVSFYIIYLSIYHFFSTLEHSNSL